MQVTVKLSAREGAAHISGILAGFILLAKRGELTLQVQDERQGSPIAREALLETEIDGRTVVFDLMDGYFYNDPAAVLALFRRADVVFKRSFSAEKNRQFPGNISAKLRPLGLNYYVTCPGSPLEAERSAKSRLKQWALSTRCYPQDFEARLTRVRKKPRILFLTRLWDPEEPAVQQYPELQAEWRQVNVDRIELLQRLQSAFPEQFTGGVSDNACARQLCPELIMPDKLTGNWPSMWRRGALSSPSRCGIPCRAALKKEKTIKRIPPRQSVRSSCGSCWQTRRRYWLWHSTMRTTIKHGCGRSSRCGRLCGSWKQGKCKGENGVWKSRNGIAALRRCASSVW